MPVNGESNPDPTIEWIRRWLRDRDETAARELMDSLYPRIAGIVAAHGPRGMDREDLVQEVFLRLFQALGRFRPDRPLEHWVSRIALNVCRTRGRARSRRPEWRWSDLSEGERAAFDAAAAEGDGPSEAIDAGDARALLLRILDGLNPSDRQILTLLHLEERSIPEIAALLGSTRAAARVRAFRARAKLRKAVEALKKRNP